MLDSLKSKLGLGDAGARGRAADRYDDYDDYDDYADDYGDYGEYGDDYDDGGEPASKYDPYSSVTTRSARSSSTISNLVSIDDVRAHSAAGSSASAESRVSRSASPARTPHRGERSMVDSSLPPTMTPEGSAAISAAASRPTKSEGLNSLFEPTSGNPSPAGKHAAAASAAASASSSAPSTQGAFTRQPSATSAAAAIAQNAQSAPATASAHAAIGRQITVLKPASYNEAERIVRALKAGDAVVLGLRNTPDSLSKRILDFSFGVSCALDASVECVGDKVFAITRAAGLSDAERTALRNQGVL